MACVINRRMSSGNSYQVTLHIVNNSPSFTGQPCYLAGNFNNWSADTHLLGAIPPKGETLQAVLAKVPAGELELKVTRGTWETLQCTSEGKLPPPFTVNINHDVTLTIAIDGWRDEFPASTASEQVHLLDADFFFPGLGRSRKVWIYLPQYYEASTAVYPVLYMHDGQHLFDEATSVGRAGPVEWMVDETIDAAERQVIVVAIDHADTYEERQQEFLMHAIADTPQPKGREYLHDIATVLKPYVDQHYRTKPQREHTAMLGSSLGGLVTLYAGLWYPEQFGMLGVFSPSIWMDRASVYEHTANTLQQKGDLIRQTNFYFYVGGREKRIGKDHHHENMGKDLREYLDFFNLEESGNAHLDMDSHGKHGALYWQQAFKRFYAYWQAKD